MRPRRHIKPLRTHAVTVAVVAVVAAGLALTPVTGALGGDDDAGADGVAAEYVVSFTGSVPAAVTAIEAAGGTIKDVVPQLGVALVGSSDETFLADVRAASVVRGAARNHAVGTARPGMPHQFAPDRPVARGRASQDGTDAVVSTSGSEPGTEPLAARQWNMAMIGATPGGAHRVATGRGVDVGIIDTGIDGRHPDIAPNFDAQRSRNFTTDIPSIDGPCEVRSCVDPVNVDPYGHGTLVAGLVAAPANGFGIGGVAPDATLVSLRAGQDSGFFFVYETAKALVYAGDARLDVANMSFYTDPWLFNCTSRSEYVSGTVTSDELAQQRLVRQLVLDAVGYAHRRGVTLVGSAGNDHVNLAAPTRVDETSPDFPLDSARPRTVKRTCLILPAEAPHVVTVSALGPSTVKADYSNYGLGSIDLSGPGGYFFDFVGTPRFERPENNVLAPYPLDVAIAEGWVDANGRPVDDFAVRYCGGGRCGVYVYLEGTSLAAPHVAGVAALIIERHGRAIGYGGRALDPAVVTAILESTATDHACPRGGVEIYTDEGAPAEFNAVCRGTRDDNGLYGEGIVDAEAAVRRR